MGLQGVFTGDVKIRNLDGLLVGVSGLVYSYDSIQATAFLNVFTSSLKGLVPASGGGTTTFLCANGTWVAPPGSGTTTNAVTFNNSGSGAASGTSFNGTTPVTVSYNTFGAQQASASLTALAGLTYASGTPFVKMTAAGVFALDTNTYLTANQTITLSGDGSGSGTTAITLTLATVNSNVGTFNNITVNAKGLVTAATNASYLTGSGTTGQVTFFTGASVIGGDSSFFWDNTNKRLGLGTATPGVRLDIHSTGIIAQFNGTGTTNAYLDFQNAGSTQWRIGNFYNGAVNQFALFNAGGGTNVLTILQGGNVGIGTTSPSYKFDVQGGPIANGNGTIVTAITYATMGIVGTLSNHDLALYTNSTEKMRITSAGNVGIGTASPSEKLHLAGNTFRQNDASNSFGYTISTTSATTTLATLFGGSSFGIRTGGSGSDNLRIDAAGNVGIGYTAPAAKLAVSGTTLINTNTDNGVDKLQVSGSATVSTDATIKRYLDVGTSGTNANAYLRTLDGSVINKVQSVGSLGAGYLGTESNHSVNLITNNIIRSVVTTSGNILIGTTSDNGVDKLQVSGSAISTQYKLSALNTAPATASSTGTLGEIRIDANYIYICTATNTWKRVAIATW